MGISTVTYKKYKTSDGKDFDSYSEAVHHETKDSFHEWYNNDNELIGSEGSKIDSNVMLGWIKDNEGYLYSFLNNLYLLYEKDK